jgi:hypothetical protein
MMLAMITAVAALAPEIQNDLFRIAKPKFDSYFAYTAASAGGMPRAVPVEGKPWYVYQSQTVIADLVALSTVFTDVYQALSEKGFAKLVKSDPFLLSQIERIFEGGQADGSGSSFWKFPAGHVPVTVAISTQLGDVLKTLRNGFAHSHWFYADLSATDYWKESGWDVASADPKFNLANRG